MEFLPYFCVLLFIVTIFVSWLTYFIIKKYKISLRPNKIVEAAILGLLGLLLAFNFNGAYSRFEERRQNFVLESSAFLYSFFVLDFLPTEERLPIQKELIKLADQRIAIYPFMNDQEAVEVFEMETAKIMETIWKLIINIDDKTNQVVQKTILDSFSNMLNKTELRTLAIRRTNAAFVFGLYIMIINLICAAIVGASMVKSGRFSWFYILSFSIAMIITIYIVLDLQYPHGGVITLDNVQERLIEIRDVMVNHLQKKF